VVRWLLFRLAALLVGLCLLVVCRWCGLIRQKVKLVCKCVHWFYLLAVKATRWDKRTPLLRSYRPLFLLLPWALLPLFVLLVVVCCVLCLLYRAARCTVRVVGRPLTRLLTLKQ
jgi:hypothetical protein